MHEQCETLCKGKRTLTKWMLSSCTVLMASVRPCRNALVIAGSYVHSILPDLQVGGKQSFMLNCTYRIAQNTPPGLPFGRMRPG